MTNERVRRGLRRGLASLVCLGTLLPSPVPADTLGDTRLFFTRDERAGSPVERGSAGPGDSAGAGVDDAEDGAAENDAAENAGIGNIDAVPPVAVRSSGRRPAIGFEALVHVGEQVLVIVGGERCRGMPEGTELQCDRGIRGIDTLALASGSRPLVVTFDDGRQLRAGVGDVIAP